MMSAMTILGVSLIVVLVLLLLASFRIVVGTNEMHIVQSTKKTVSYGKDQPAGNTYYRWPAFLPVIGVQVIKLPVSVFSINLDGYAAYDKGRVPFMIDIMAFFRITDSNMAAQRLSSVEEARKQLNGILQGVCRTILANSEIEEILQGRSQFGKMFTNEVDDNLKQWGMQSVKQIELMDIRDAQGSAVISQIMAKKKSLIEMQSRMEVANNIQQAQTAEITAAQAVAVRKQEADQQVGIRTAQKDQEVGIAGQKAQQAVQVEAAMTADKEMSVLRVKRVRQAEIDREAQVVGADQLRQTQVIDADATRQKTVAVAQGDLDAAKLKAQGVQAVGEAEGAAETAKLMAPVNAQTALAKEIGNNPGYQSYLITVRGIEKDQAVGIEQARALEKADVKVIANTGSPVDGVKTVMELFTAKGGTQLAAMVEAMAQTPVGAAIAKHINGGPT